MLKSSKNVKLTFKGFVDKILLLNKNDYNIVVLIDYKTGEQDIDLSLVKYGLSLQLPVYLYLAKNSEIQNIKFAGFYLQKILHNKEVAKKDKTLEQIKKENLMLVGYSNSDVSILKEFDPHYKNSIFIKGLKTTLNEEFFKSSKVINTESIDKLTDLVHQKIESAAKNILDGNFIINPKVIDEENVSCKFCKFKSICYVKEKDRIVIRKEENDREV